MPRRLCQQRQGFTLFEVLLSLALSVVLLGLLTFSISVYLRASNTGREDVERAQLARVLLRRIADDLRSTIWYEPIDAEALVSGTSSTGSGNGSGNGTGGATGSGNSSGTGNGGATGPSTGTSNSGTSTSGAATSTGGVSSSGSASSSATTEQSTFPVLGLYGTQYGVQVDVSRLPRIEQYDATAASAGSSALDLVSDVKSIEYYCLSASSGLSAAAGGLVRRELDRAVTNYANYTGNLAAFDQQQVPLADEVTALEFRYFDGTQWGADWDSEVAGGLPRAVEIAITLGGAAPVMGEPEFSEETSLAATTGTTYRMLVYLPQSSATSGAANAAAYGNAGATASGGDQGGTGTGNAASGAQGGGSSGRGGGYGEGGGQPTPDGGGQGGGQGGPGGRGGQDE